MVFLRRSWIFEHKKLVRVVTTLMLRSSDFRFERRGVYVYIYIVFKSLKLSEQGLGEMLDKVHTFKASSSRNILHRKIDHIERKSITRRFWPLASYPPAFFRSPLRKCLYGLLSLCFDWFRRLSSNLVIEPPRFYHIFHVHQTAM